MDSFLPEGLSGHHYLFIVAIMLVIVLYAYDMYDDKDCCCDNNDALDVYSYDNINGPQCWSKMFNNAKGKKQSPINLLQTFAREIPIKSVSPLFFSEEFHTIPKEMKLYNNSHTAVIYATWECNKKPFISGGPLCGVYKFLNMRFRWGPNDQEGSEHMVNSMCYSMELQIAFIKSGAEEEDMVTAAANGSLVMLSYLFLTTPRDNPYLEPIILGLRDIRNPMSYVCIEPVILSLIIPTFSRDFYSYLGSLTYPPCTEGVLWIIKCEPLMISSRQVRQFRRLNGCFGEIIGNTRPVQTLNNREISYYG